MTTGKCRPLFGIAALTTAATAHANHAEDPSAAMMLEARGRYMVILQDSAGADTHGLAHSLAARVGATPEQLYTASIRGFSARIPAHLLSQLANDPAVQFIEQDGLASIAGATTNGKGKPPDSTPPPQQLPWGIVRVGGPALKPTRAQAWVIDSGIDLKHPDLNVGNAVSFVRGKDLSDQNGHGTHVAGTIAACDNDIGVVGVAPCALVHSVKVLGASGWGFWSEIAAGIDYVAANARAGDVANISIGGTPSEIVDEAVRKLAATGVHVVISAGNSSDFAGNYSPARVDASNVYTISAIAEGDKFATFSNFGNPPVDYAAPGVDVLSLAPGGGTATYYGTSMAAPHVSGILLFGRIGSDGGAIDDPDTNPDPIAYLR